MAAKNGAFKVEIAKEVKRTPEEYLPNLLRIVRSFRESVTLRPAKESFRQGWEEARRGDTRPLAELWDTTDGA